MFKSSLKPLLPLGCWLLIAILLVFAYWPSLNGPMVFDDQVNIVKNPGVAIRDLSLPSLEKALLSNESGRLKRMLPALSFGINHYFAGGFTNTWVFKATNLAIHIINSGLVFWLVFMLWPRLFAGDESQSEPSLSSAFSCPSTYSIRLFFSALATLIWALHPLQLTTVAYVVQRMTSMAGLFVLLGLCLFVHGRVRLDRKPPAALAWMTLGVLGGTVMGLLCKENAGLLILYAGVIEFTLFDRNGLPGKAKKPLYGFYGLFLLLPVAAALMYLLMNQGEILGGYIGRPFTLYERLLTEARVLWFYLYVLFIPDITVLGLYHDDIPLSKDWLTPVTTLIAIFAWVVLSVSAWLLRKKLPLLAFAVFWYLAGHSMESSVIALDLVYEHRNYLPSLGMVMLFCAVLYHLSCLLRNFLKTDGPLDPVKTPWRSTTLFGSVCLLLAGGLFYATFSRAEYWRTRNSLFTSIGLNHPQSPISQYLYGEVIFKKYNQPFKAYPYYFKAAQLNPQETGFLISAVMATPAQVMAEIQGQPIAELVNPRYIAEQLKTNPISPWCITLLDAEAKCVQAANTRCIPHVDAMISWLQAANENKRLSMFYKRQFIQQLFHIQMKYARFKDALKTVTEAQAEDSRLFHYYLMRAEALRALGRYDEALTLLSTAENLARTYNPGLLPNIYRVRRAVAESVKRRGPRRIMSNEAPLS